MLRAKAQPLIELPDRVVCTQSFRPSFPVSREIQRGEVFQRDNSLVTRFPDYFHFEIPLTELLAKERGNDA
jgi:hypothetical protein